MGFFSSIIKPLAYLSLPAILLRSISAASPEGRYYTRIFIYLGTIAGVATASVVTATALAILGRPYDVNYYVASMFYGVASRLLDIKVEMEGEEYLDHKPAIIMSNHQSILDLMIIARTMKKNMSILAKKEVKLTPVGPFMMLSGAIFIDRGNNERAVRSLRAATDLMKRLKISLLMYPEGTRNLVPEADLLPFKKGGFHMAVEAGIPVIPMVTENYWHIYRKVFFGTGVIKVRVLPPISTESLTSGDVSGLMDRVRDQMVETLREISIHAHKPTIAEEKKSKPTQVAEKEEQQQQQVFSGASIAVNPSTPSLDSDMESTKLDGLKGSTVSLASTTSSQQWKSTTGSEAGGETEEEEGMILVGRPEKK